MGNKNSTPKAKKTKKQSEDNNRRKSLSSRLRRSLSSISTPKSKEEESKKQHSYAEILQLIESELLIHVQFSSDLAKEILSFIPRSTMGDESNPINPYDVLNIHVQIISPFLKVPPRVLSIFNCLSPNCHCGGVLRSIQYQKIHYDEYRKCTDVDMVCGKCGKKLQASNEVLNYYNDYYAEYYECTSVDTKKHKANYKICKRCTFQNVSTFFSDSTGRVYETKQIEKSLGKDKNIFKPKYMPPKNVSHGLNARSHVQRRVCLAFTDEYIRVYLHCLYNPSSADHSSVLRQKFTRRPRWTEDLYEPQVAILMDDFNNPWLNREHWIDDMEKWTGGGADSIFTAICHCNESINRLRYKAEIEQYLKMIQNRKSTPWKNLSTKVWQCSMMENEDTITAVLDIVGIYLSNLTEEEKFKLTLRSKLGRKSAK